MKKQLLGGAVSALLLASAPAAWSTCAQLGYDTLRNAAFTAAGADTGGYGLPMWVTFVDETGKVCAVTTTGDTGTYAGNKEWLGSRVISAQKANTANAFSLNGYAISTANLYAPVQGGQGASPFYAGSLFGLQFSNPVDPNVAYAGNPNQYGKKNDPLKNKRPGGVNVFGGGLALYSGGVKIGAIGVSGDTSCRDHAFAWNVRKNLGMEPTAPTVGITTANMNFEGKPADALTGAAKGDEMIISPPSIGINSTNSYWSFWAQPACPNSLSATVATPANGVLVLK